MVVLDVLNELTDPEALGEADEEVVDAFLDSGMLLIVLRALCDW